MKKMLLYWMVCGLVLFFSGGGSAAYLCDIVSSDGSFSAGEWEEPSQQGEDPGNYTGPDHGCGNGVKVDIEPGKYPNFVNPCSRGVIKAAILSDFDFDATQIDETTVVCGPKEAGIFQWRIEDVNHDRINDMLLVFCVQDTGIRAGATGMEIHGRTLAGDYFWGSDDIVTFSGE